MSKITTTKKERAQMQIKTINTPKGKKLSVRIMGYNPPEKRTFISDPKDENRMAYISKDQRINWRKMEKRERRLKLAKMYGSKIK